MVNKDLHISSKHGRVKDNRRLTVLLLSETSLKRVIPFPGGVISWRGRHAHLHVYSLSDRVRRIAKSIRARRLHRIMYDRVSANC